MDKKAIFKDEMIALANEFINVIDKETNGNYDKVLNIMSLQDAIIITTTTQSANLNKYPVVMVFSYTLGMVYFYLSISRPEGLNDMDFYKVINNMNIKHKVSNTSFMASDKETIVMKYIDILVDAQDVKFILNSLTTFADKELF